MPSACRTRRRRFLTARAPLVVAAALALLAAALHQLPVSAANGSVAWEDGLVTVYDASGMTETVNTAAARWNASGAKVRIVRVPSPEKADVTIKVDDRALLRVCGRDCLGYTTTIGRPADGHTTVLLAEELGGPPRPLSVWVAAHEFGHVLGLSHRDGRVCSLMSEHAFDTGCAPSLAAEEPTSAQLACVPAPTDVEDAAKIYGGEPYFRDPRCR